MEPEEPHVCDWPSHSGEWSKFPQKWTCPVCGTQWEESYDDDEDIGVYWDRV